MEDLPNVPDNAAVVADAINELVEGVRDPEVTYGIETDGYGKCVEAMWRAAYIAHEYVARRLGVTGFQHGASALTVVGKLRRIEGPYRLVDVEQALFPQYDPVGDTAEFLRSDSVRTWLADEAQKRLDEFESEPEFLEWTDEDGTERRIRRVASRVEKHWQRLVADRPAEVIES